MYVKAILKIFERLKAKHDEKGESFRSLPEKRLNDILCGEFEEWYNLINDKEPYDRANEIDELCDIVVASIIKIEWLIQGGQKLKDISGRTPDRSD